MPEQYAAKPRVEIDGAFLGDEFDLRLERTVVDDDLYLPDMFELTFRDPDRDVLEQAGVGIGSRVRVFAAPLGEEANEPLIAGEVTAIEAEFDATGSHTIARGYDYSHRLHRGRITDSYRDATDSDIVRRVASRVGLEVGRMEETTTTHRYVSQVNQSDWEFLHGRAREIGYELAVVDGKLEFRQPADAAEAPEAGDFTSTDPLQLVLGLDLEAFRPRVTSAEQVSEVQVRGWDPDQKRALVGTAEAATTSASLDSYTPSELAAKFGSPTYVAVDRPYSNQDDVDAAALVLAEQIGGAFAEAEGIALGNPDLKAGAALSIGLAGRSFDGMYTVTSSRHVFDVDGYRTRFSVTGRQDRSLLRLASPRQGPGSGQSGSAVHGVVIAQVTNVNDPDDLARVKLSFPWLSDTFETDWVRVVQAGAGKGRGMVVLPEVNDEVLVAFEHGDVARPYVLGGLYNGTDKPEVGDGLVDGSTGEIRRRGFVSKKGHCIVFLDDDRKEGIAILTRDQELRISLNTTDTTIKISSKGDVVIEADGEVSVKGREVKLSADAGVSIDAGRGNVTIKGTQIQLN